MLESGVVKIYFLLRIGVNIQVFWVGSLRFLSRLNRSVFLFSGNAVYSQPVSVFVTLAFFFRILFCKTIFCRRLATMLKQRLKDFFCDLLILEECVRWSV